MKISCRIIVKGQVQGVGYRYFAQRQAEQTGLCGYVKNLYNGDVEVFVEAPNVKNTNFSGEVKIINVENEEDYEIMPVTLTTPKNIAFNISTFFLKFLEQHPHLFSILRLILKS